MRRKWGGAQGGSSEGPSDGKGEKISSLANKRIGYRKRLP